SGDCCEASPPASLRITGAGNSDLNMSNLSRELVESATALVSMGRQEEALHVLGSAPLWPDSAESTLVEDALTLRMNCLHDLGKWEELASLGSDLVSRLSRGGLSRSLCAAHAHLGVAQLRLGNL